MSTRTAAIDINSDLGESYGPWRMGDDEAMLRVVTSANVACGGHASDPETMHKTLRLAKERGVVVGAHPGYPDKEGFGRRLIPCSVAEIERFTAAQIGALMGVAALAGTTVCYVKPHGALGNLSADDRAVADGIVRATAAIDRNLAVLAIAGGELEHAAKAKGLATFSEIFADRGYTPKGRLVPRGTPGAMIEDAGAAAARLLGYLKSGLMPTVGGEPIRLEAHSICVHGDGAHAVEIAGGLRKALEAGGMTIRAFLAS